MDSTTSKVGIVVIRYFKKHHQLLSVCDISWSIRGWLWMRNQRDSGIKWSLIILRYYS